jgi:GDPmannose 4,6-dehydratase
LLINMPSAFITGITGQDGSYLTELLIEKGYTVHGMVRRTSVLERSRIEALRSDPAIYNRSLFLHYGDLNDPTTLRRLLIKAQPDELYHLAGQSHVGLSFEIPESTCQETAMATLSLLEICRDLAKPPRFFHAASSELFGSPASCPQNEQTPFLPASPYGCAKAFAAQLCRVYREAHGLFVCNGISYNHESPRRGENFVTRKITAAAARIAAGSNEIIELGNLDASRDWGWAPEFVDAMWRILQQPEPQDYILATGTITTVREFARAAFAAMDIPLIFEGDKTDEVGRHGLSKKVLIKVNSRFYRAADPIGLVGNPALAAHLLGWQPQTSGIEVAQAMAKAEALRPKSAISGS